MHFITCWSKCLVTSKFKPVWIWFVYSWRHSRTEPKWDSRCTSLLRLQTENTTHQIVLKGRISCSLHQIIHINLRVWVVSHRWMRAVSKRSALRNRWRTIWDEAGASRGQSLVLTHRSLELPIRTIRQKDSPLISLVNLTRWESVRGRGCSSMLWMSRTSHMNWMTGCAL